MSDIYYVTQFVIFKSDEDLHDRLIASGKIVSRMSGPFPNTFEIGLRSDSLKEAISVAHEYEDCMPYPTEIHVRGWPTKDGESG